MHKLAFPYRTGQYQVVLKPTARGLELSSSKINLLVHNFDHDYMQVRLKYVNVLQDTVREHEYMYVN